MTNPQEAAGEYGGVFDDVREVMEWQPMLSLLRATRTAENGPAKLAAIRVALAFFLKKAYGADPERMPAFAAFSLLVDLAKTDERVRRLVALLMEPTA